MELSNHFENITVTQLHYSLNNSKKTTPVSSFLLAIDKSSVLTHEHTLQTQQLGDK